MELTLTPEIEDAIKTQASQKGTTPEQLALEGLRKLFVPAADNGEKSPESLADFLDGYIGVIQSSEHVEGGAQMSQDTGDKFAALIKQKRTQNQL